MDWLDDQRRQDAADELGRKLRRVDIRTDYPAITILADACVDKADDGVPEAVRAWREVGRLRHEVDCLREECKAWMNGVADVVELLGYDRHAACGPADLLPGLTELREHGAEMARRLRECVEARAYLNKRVGDVD